MSPPRTRPRPLVLDLSCGAGGAGEGYRRAGFDVIGVDIAPHDYRPGPMLVADALDLLSLWNGEVGGVDLVHASPPRQAYTNAQRIMGKEHPDLISLLRLLLDGFGRPYVIENVVGAPLRQPILLCGAMFGLRTYRHRLFEVSGFTVNAPPHPEHTAPTTKMGRPPRPGEFMHIVGNFSGVQAGREAMGIDWPMRRDDLREAIPPAYTEHIGRALLAQRQAVAA